MTELGAVLGAILAEVTRARVEADRETARLTELYATDPLLRHMPVPHFRLPEVSVDIPVVIDDVEVDDRTPPAPAVPGVRKRQQMVNQAAKVAGVKLERVDKDRIHAQLGSAVERLDVTPTRNLSRRAIIHELGAAAARGLGDASTDRPEAIDRAARRTFDRALRDLLIDELDLDLARKGRVQVSARTDEIATRQRDTTEAQVVRVNLKISEESYEIRVGAEDGEAVEYFGPE